MRYNTVGFLHTFIENAAKTQTADQGLKNELPEYEAKVSAYINLVRDFVDQKQKNLTVVENRGSQVQDYFNKSTELLDELIPWHVYRRVFITQEMGIQFQVPDFNGTRIVFEVFFDYDHSDPESVEAVFSVFEKTNRIGSKAGTLDTVKAEMKNVIGGRRQDSTTVQSTDKRLQTSS